ncbi:MAG: hypothetical protein PHG85_03910 [Candidatus Altiarchaeota archaeon]|nr:hypothetical protein [Candidatus Altiarchaeota archaeon]
MTKPEVTQPAEASTPQQSNTKAATTTQAAGGVVSDIKDLVSAMSSGGSYRCTYSFKDVSMDALIKGKMYRSHSTVEGVSYTTVSDGTWVYTWAEGAATGIKFNIEKMKSSSGKPEGYTDLSDVSKSAVQVDCKAEVISDSMFSVPSQVTFQDMSDITASACGVCGMMPDEEAKSQCLANCGQ